MNTHSNRRQGLHRRSRRLVGVAAAVGLVAAGALGAHTYASDDDNTLEQPSSPPGDVISAEQDELVLGSEPQIRTSGSTFDETVLTKFIPAAAFDPFNGNDFEEDLIDIDSATCYRSDAAAVGTKTKLLAPVELPDGSRIKRVTFYGEDSFAGDDIDIRLHRQLFTSMPSVAPFPPSVSRSDTVVDEFSTSGSGGNTVVSGADDLGELVGTPSAGGILTVFNSPNRFHTIEVSLDNDANADHVLCGVKVWYQVVAAADPGTVFHPIDSVRAFDSRLAALPESGRLGPNETKVIDITDGYDADGVAIPAQANAVPTNATAVAYNITIAGADGPNFVAVTAGDAASFTASTINYSAGSNVANGSTVILAADQTIKLWGGNNTGSSHVLIDIVGFHAPPVASNMAN